jgi:maltase-glucoamylase
VDPNDIKFTDIRILGMDKEPTDCNVLTNNNIIPISSYNYNASAKVRDHSICGTLSESLVLGF